MSKSPFFLHEIQVTLMNAHIYALSSTDPLAETHIHANTHTRDVEQNTDLM